MDKIIEVIYTSTVNSNVNFNEIVRKSKINNYRNKITGCLLQYKSFVIQVIEGPKSKVMTLLDKIERDLRHSNIRVIYQGETTRRSFPNWTMISYEMTPQEFVEMIRYLKIDDKNKVKEVIYNTVMENYSH